MSADQTLRRVCAWCRTPLDALGPVGAGQTVSHGLCKTCAGRMARTEVTRARHQAAARKSWEGLTAEQRRERTAPAKAARWAKKQQEKLKKAENSVKPEEKA